MFVAYVCGKFFFHDGIPYYGKYDLWENNECVWIIPGTID